MNPQQDHIELQDLGRGPRLNNVLLDQPNPLAIGAEVFRAKESHRRRSWATILALAILVCVLLITTTTLGVLYGTTQMVGPPGTSTNIIISPVTQTTTSLTTTTVVSTQPTTETETSTTISTETTRRSAKTTTASVTTIVTTTLYIIATQTTSETASTTMSAPMSSRCIPQGLYGGDELHLINGDYDVDIDNAIWRATNSSLIDIGQDDPFAVALRSIYQCVSEDDVDLIVACEKQYTRDALGVACAGPSYSTLPVVITTTDVSTTVTWSTTTMTGAKLRQTGP